MESGHTQTSCLILAYAGKAARLRGRSQEALELLERSTEAAGDSLLQLMHAHTELALVCRDLERIEAAEPHLAFLREGVASGEDWRGRVGSLALAEAVIAGARGELATAEREFVRAREIFRKFRAPFEESEALYCWGRALVDAGQRGDALEKLDEALAVLRRIGAGTSWLERVLALKMRAQGSSSSNIKASIALVASTVDARRPDMSRVVNADGEVTLMFSDMAGYTEMTERLGDHEALRVVQTHNEIVRRECDAHGGFEVELRGDGFLLAFPSALAGVRCGIALQRAFVAYSERHPEEPIRLRIGLHTGEAIRDVDKFFGKTVIQAFRIADLAAANEILVSEDIRQRSEGAGNVRFVDGQLATLKGISGEHQLLVVEWH